ncbi:MAG TPA: IS200/IS605 family transposase [Spartobacteria bacterium]|jgi:REP element-mobilizing transposase RayT|nr:IS200/IS605 family transposase [Spartobacteria bacterium]
MHSFNSCLIHCVWSTKNREPLLTSDLRDRLWPYLGGIAKQNKMNALAIGGASDHVHILISLPATLSVAKAVQLLKGNSSKWIHETFPKLRGFEWQEGYGAFSISISGVDETVAYIRNQEEHHRRRSFREEVMAMLRKHDADYDEALLD